MSTSASANLSRCFVVRIGGREHLHRSDRLCRGAALQSLPPHGSTLLCPRRVEQVRILV